jgi:hypothetical protein
MPPRPGLSRVGVIGLAAALLVDPSVARPASAAEVGDVLVGATAGFLFAELVHAMRRPTSSPSAMTTQGLLQMAETTAGRGGLAPPPAPAFPRVLHYPHGSFELRGDGVTSPYAWVWVPRSPAPPPSPAR